MKLVPGTDIPVRLKRPTEQIELVGHAGDCRYCGGVVKMPRDRKGEIQPNKCWCLLCGQHYFVEIPGSITEWEWQQWVQKTKLEVKRTVKPRSKKLK